MPRKFKDTGPQKRKAVDEEPEGSRKTARRTAEEVDGLLASHLRALPTRSSGFVPINQRRAREEAEEADATQANTVADDEQAVESDEATIVGDKEEAASDEDAVVGNDQCPGKRMLRPRPTKRPALYNGADADNDSGSEFDGEAGDQDSNADTDAAEDFSDGIADADLDPIEVYNTVPKKLKTCERCNGRHQKCDGGHACKRCVDAEALCEYREHANQPKDDKRPRNPKLPRLARMDMAAAIEELAPEFNGQAKDYHVICLEICKFKNTWHLVNGQKVPKYTWEDTADFCKDLFPNAGKQCTADSLKSLWKARHEQVDFLVPNDPKLPPKRRVQKRSADEREPVVVDDAE